MKRAIAVVVLAASALAVVVCLRHAPRTTAPGRPAATATSAAERTSANATSATATPPPSVAAEGTPPPATAPAMNDPVGVIQPVAEHVNAQTESVVDAERSGDHPERLSALIAPKPFDREAFLRDPKAYLDVVEPARVYQSAAPAEDVPVLQRLGPTAFVMRQDEEIALRVRTQPGWPVTFTSFDCGRFANQLATQTVQADENGAAAVRFTAGPGTINRVRVLAGSPGASGQVAFHIDVQPSLATAASVR